MSFYDDDETPFVLKIKGGTVSGKTNLCKTCRDSHITRDRNNQEVTICNSGRARLITSPIAECNRYDDESLPSLYDLRQIAWTVETDKKTKQVGFLSPDELRKRKQRDD